MTGSVTAGLLWTTGRNGGRHEAVLLEHAGHGLTQGRRVGRDRDTGGGQDRHLLLGGLSHGRYDRAGVSHLPAFGRRQAGDVGDDRLGHTVPHVGRALGLLRTADLPDHHHRIGLAIGLEQLEDVAEGRSVDAVTADADRSRDPDAERLHLRGGLVAQRARAADDADPSGQVDVAWHDAEHGPPR
jgi:hypothetical protein